MEKKIQKAVEALAEKCEKCSNSNDALKYSQSVNNLTNALMGLVQFYKQ